jgi:DNA-directed RNA polymerase subunit E'
MFYKIQVNDHVRVPPNLFGMDAEESILEVLKKNYDGFLSKDVGVVIGVSALSKVGEGVIIPGDGSHYYDCDFELLAFRPELQELVYGNIKDIADFGAFINLGIVDGMVHIGQTMDDFVSFGSDKALTGKESKRSLKVGDKCIARIIAVSFKDVANPKIGLTMRQPGLGKLEWVEEDMTKSEDKEEKEKKEKSPVKKKEEKSKGKPASKKK